MDWTQPSVIISILALTISFISLGWNIWSKVKDDKRKLDITATVNKSREQDRLYSCTVSVTNLGQKPVTIRQIVLYEKDNGKEKYIHTTYRDYSKDIENNPIDSGEWRHITLYDSKQHSFYNDEQKDYKVLCITIIDSKKNKYKTNWFRQSLKA